MPLFNGGVEVAIGMHEEDSGFLASALLGMR